VKVSVRDIEKIPTSKLFKMEQCFFVIKFEVERDLGGNNEENNDDDGQDNQVQVDEEEEIGDEFADQIEKAKCGATSNDTDAHTPTPSGSRGMQHNINQNIGIQGLEESVKE
jgi:hypothetical protein